MQVARNKSSASSKINIWHHCQHLIGPTEGSITFSFSWCLFTKATNNKFIQPWRYKPRTTRIKKVQLSSRKQNYKVLLYFFYWRYNRKRCVFSLWRKMYRLSDVLIHHLGARTANSRDFRECLVRSEGATSRLADAEQSGRAGCKVWLCPGCRPDPIRSQHGTQVLVFWNGCGQPLVTSEGSGGAE